MTKQESFKKAFMPAYAIIQQLKGEHYLPERVVRTALEVYKKLMNSKGTRGRNRDELVKACIMIASDNLNYPLMIKEWKSRELMRQKRYVNRVTGLKQRRVEAHMYASRIGWELRLSEKEISEAIKLCNDAYGTGIACAALNKACRVSLRKLARITGLSRNYVWRLSKDL